MVDDEIVLTELFGTRWILQYIEGHEPIANTHITLQTSPKRFSGSAGCNAYCAEYTTKSQNSAIYASFRDMGYPVEDTHEVPPAWRARLLTLVLGIDAAVVVGAIVFPGAWVIVTLPALGLVTFTWALPRLR